MSGVSHDISDVKSSPVARQPTNARSVLHDKWLHPAVWLTLATSSIVFIEPAPYDLLVIALACAAFCLGLSVPRALGPAVFLLGLFLIGNLGGALAGGYTEVGIRSLSIRIYMVLAWLFFACLIARNPRRTIQIVWSGYSFAALVAVAWGILQYYGYLPGELVGPEQRATGPFKDANVFAPFLVPITLLTVAKIFRARGIQLAITIAWFLALMLGILLAFSRGAWINFIASFGFLSTLLLVSAASRRQQLNFVLMIILLGLAGSATLFWVVTGTAAGELFMERTALVQAYDVAEGGRFATQLEAVKAIGQTPFGIGPGMSTPILGMEPHNLYLHTAIEGGWLGGSSWYALLLLSLWRGVAELKRASGELKVHILIVLASLLGVLLQSFFIDSTHWRHLWLMLAMLWGLTSGERRADHGSR